MDLVARPTVYRGIQMRSRLEARFAAHLDSVLPGVWSYEPQAFASRIGQYLPDFAIRTGVPGVTVYIEVRATLERAREALGQMVIILASEPDAVLTVVVPPLGIQLSATRFQPWAESVLVPIP